MHRCLQIVEMVEHLAGSLAGSLDAEKQSLVNMSLACRTLYGPTMNALRETFEYFLPLLYCPPDDIVQYKEAEEDAYHCQQL